MLEIGFSVVENLNGRTMKILEDYLNFADLLYKVVQSHRSHALLVFF